MHRGLHTHARGIPGQLLIQRLIEVLKTVQSSLLVSGGQVVLPYSAHGRAAQCGRLHGANPAGKDNVSKLVLFL